jgi:hypothetical protein
MIVDLLQPYLGNICFDETRREDFNAIPKLVKYFPSGEDGWGPSPPRWSIFFLL